MGVRDMYKVLAQKDLKPPIADLAQLPPNCMLEVDLMGTSMLWARMRRLLTDDYNETAARSAGTKMASYIKNIFVGDGRKVTLHVDGGHNLEKQQEHEKRAEDLVKTQEKLDTALQLMKRRSNHGKYTCKTVLEKIKKTLSALFVLTQADKNSLCEAMSSFDPSNITVCRCATEADLCIAQSLDRELVPGQKLVVSSDSDFLVYLPVERVLRSIPKTTSFAWYTKADVRQALQLPSDQHLLLLGIVAANDYGKNVRSLGIIRNCDIIRDIQPGSIEDMLESYMGAASAQVDWQVDRTLFDASKRVMHDLVDTPLPLAERSNQLFLDRLHEFRGLISQRHENARQARALKQQSDLPFYVAPHSHRNQFRNHFTSKDTILRTQKVVDLNAVKEHAPPPEKKPQTGPRPRTRQARTKKKRQKHKAKAKEVDQPYKRQLQSSTKHDHGLMKKHITKTLTIGCINHAVHQTLLPKQTSEAESEARRKARIVTTKLRSTALVMNQLQTHAYEIIALDIASIINSAESTSSTMQISPLQLTQDQLGDLDDLLDNQNFYYNLGTLLLNGSLGPASEYERRKRAPKRTVSTRRTSAAAQVSPEEVSVPHSVRAFERYQAQTGFVPFNLRVETSASDQAQSSSSTQAASTGQGQKINANAVRLSLRSVKSAIRGHYVGSKFPDQPDRDDHTNAIVYFFDHNRQSHEFRDFPCAKWAPGFVFFSESDLVHLLFTDSTTRPILLEALGHDVKTVTQAEKLVVNRKGILIENLFFNTNANHRLNGYSGKVSLQQDTSRLTKYKLRGTICTNGLQLHLLAHDTSTTRRKRVDHRMEDDEDSDLFGGVQDIEAEFELDEAFVAEEGEVDEGVGQVDEEVEQEGHPEHEGINWTRGSRVLVNVAKKFASPEDCAAFPAHDTVIVGMDPGERNTMTATRIDPQKSNERTSVTIRRSFLYRPYLLFRRKLEERKEEAGIDQVEARLPTMSLSTMDQYLQYLDQGGNRARLTAFYHDPWFSKKKWDMKKAQLAAMDHGIKAILSLVDDHHGSEGLPRRRRPQRPVIFAIGLGSFDTQTGLSSKHGAFEKRFIKRVQGMGFDVSGVHEYYTSAKCPRRGCAQFLVPCGKRSKYCPGCRMYVDRDVVGSENIGTICQAQITDQRRPAKFMPS